MWVIVDQLTKLAHFLVVRMTFTLEEFGRLYIQEIIQDYPITWGTRIYSIRSGSQVYESFLEEFLASHGDTIDDEHCFSSPDGLSVRDDHLDFRGHATSMRPRSQG